MSLPFKAGDTRGYYVASRPITAEEIVSMANHLVRRRFSRGRVLLSPADAADFLVHRLAGLEYEVFCAVFLDTRHRVLSFDQMFRGTVNGATVHAREVVKCALRLNASAVIFSHNHPSGEPEPSQADFALTNRLKDALSLVDVRVLDHLVVGVGGVVSLAERGSL